MFVNFRALKALKTASMFDCQTNSNAICGVTGAFAARAALRYARTNNMKVPEAPTMPKMPSGMSAPLFEGFASAAPNNGCWHDQSKSWMLRDVQFSKRATQHFAPLLINICRIFYDILENHHASKRGVCIFRDNMFRMIWRRVLLPYCYGQAVISRGLTCRAFARSTVSKRKCRVGRR